MTSLLNRMLPIYALRERRAQRLVYEKRQLHQMAQKALLDAQHQQRALVARSDKVRVSVLAATEFSVGEALCAIGHAGRLLHQAAEFEMRVPQLNADLSEANEVLSEFRMVYAQKLRKKEAITAASKQSDLLLSRQAQARLEQELEDELCLIRAHSQSPAQTPSQAAKR